PPTITVSNDSDCAAISASLVVSPEARRRRVTQHRLDPPTSRESRVVISDHPRAESDEAVLEGEGRRARAGRDAELREDVVNVPRDRVLADHERRCDVAIALAGGDQSEHLQLARRQPVRVARTGADLRQVGLGSEALEDVPRGLVLECCRLLVTQQATRLAEEDASAGDLVGRLERMPRLARAAQRAGCG